MSAPANQMHVPVVDLRRRFDLSSIKSNDNTRIILTLAEKEQLVGEKTEEPEEVC